MKTWHQEDSEFRRFFVEALAAMSLVQGLGLSAECGVQTSEAQYGQIHIVVMGRGRKFVVNIGTWPYLLGEWVRLYEEWIARVNAGERPLRDQLQTAVDTSQTVKDFAVLVTKLQLAGLLEDT